MVRKLLIAATLLALGGCYPQPGIDQCTVQCGAGGACPSGTSCGSDGFCHTPATAGTTCSAIDASVIDGAPTTDANLDTDATVFGDAGVEGALALRAIGFGSAGGDFVLDIAVGAAGVVAVGSLEGNVTIDGVTPPSLIGTRDGFVLTMDDELAAQGLRLLGGVGVSTAMRDVDVAGNRVLVAGTADGTISFSDGPDTCEYFVAEYEAMPGEDWHHCVATDSTGNGVAIDATTGAVLTTGLYGGTANFGDGNMTSSGVFDAFIASYDAAGVFQHADGYGGSDPTYQARGEEIDADDASNRYVTGFFAGDLNLGGTTMSTLALATFVASYDSARAHRWSVPFTGTSGTCAANDLVVGAAQDVFVTGTLSGSIDFGDATRTGDGFLARLDASTGATIWSRTFETTGSQLLPHAVAVNSAGEVYVVGAYEGTIRFQGAERTSNGVQAAFVAKISKDGDLRWMRSFGGAGDVQATAIAIANTGRIYVGGYYTGATSFDGNAVTHVGSQDAFVIELTE